MIVHIVSVMTIRLVMMAILIIARELRVMRVWLVMMTVPIVG